MTLTDLWRAEREPLVRHLRRKHRLIPADAEDIASEAFTRMVDEGGDDPAVLYRKAQSLAVDLWRRGYSTDEGLTTHNTPSVTFEQAAELRVDLIRALDALPADERQAFALTELRGLTEREAASLLGVSQKTVNRRAEKARLTLREELA